MKNLFVLVFLSIITIGSVFSQNDLAQQEDRLPKAGEMAIGVNALPFLSYMGNMFNGNLNNYTSFNFINGQSIIGKYMLTDNKALRAGVRLGFRSISKEAEVFKNGTTTEEKVTDKISVSGTNINLTIGLEKRKGTKKIQGYMGAEIGLSYGGGNTVEYTYGNAYSTTVTSPTSYEFSGDGDIVGNGVPRNTYSSSRYTKYVTGSTFGLGVRGFVGVEYFIIPKLSLGGEFGWGLGISSTGDTESTSESWDFTNKVAKSTTSKTIGSTKFKMDTDNYGGIISLFFYF